MNRNGGDMDLFKIISILLTLTSSIVCAIEMPYWPIEIPNAKSPDRRLADSLNVLIGSIRVNQAGYLPSDAEKLIYVIGNATTFDIVKASDSSVVNTGTLLQTNYSTESSIKIVADSNYTNSTNVIYTMQGSGPSGDIKKGILPSGLPTDTPLRIRIGSNYSADFVISEKVYTYVRNAAMRFFGLQQSKHKKDGMGSIVDNGGLVVSGMSGNKGALAGGWYDCGDHLKESQTQAYAAAVLALMAAAHSEKDQDEYDATQSDPSKKDGVPDMLSEAKYGADFVLAAYDFAGGVIDNMPVSIGNFNSDHNFWGLPATQESMPASESGRGGPSERDVRLGELGANISAEFAANLAIVSKLYTNRDSSYSAKCLKVAKELYDFAKSLATGKSTYGNNLAFVYNTRAFGWGSPAYNGNNEFFDDLALAAVALLYATSDGAYLDDAAESKTLGTIPAQQFMAETGIFSGGWFVTPGKGFLKNGKNTSWANSYTYALYAFYKLILETEAKATSYGITNAKRLVYIENILLTMGINLGDVSNGGANISLPSGAIGWKPSKVGYDPIWYSMYTDAPWLYNRYQVGNAFEVLAYAEIAKSVDGIKFPNVGVAAWKASEVRQVGIHQMDYLLGLNPWDLSFIYGVGDKNDMHPHHRQANPEGRAPKYGAYVNPDYDYQVPVGGLYGGMRPGEKNALVPLTSSWMDYQLSDVCLDASTTLLGSLVILADKSKVPQPASNQPSVRHASIDMKAKVVNSSLYVDAILPKSQSVRIQILGINGKRLLHKVVEGHAGLNQWIFHLGEQPKGLSVVLIKSEDLQQSFHVPIIQSH